MGQAAILTDGGWALRPSPRPQGPGPGEILVRMLFAPVNPADVLAAQGRYAASLVEGSVMGAEGVGEVISVGKDVTSLVPGDLVLPLDRGNWASWRLVAVPRLLKVPAGTNPMRAALMRINPLTARLLLEASGASHGQRIVQNAARSSVAGWVRYFAALQEIEVVNLVRGPIRPSEQGMTYTDGPGWECDLPGVAPVAALDCIAGNATGQLAKIVAPAGRIVVFGHLSGLPMTVSSQTMTGAQLSISGFSLRLAEANYSTTQLDGFWADLWAGAHHIRPERKITQIVPAAALSNPTAIIARATRDKLLLDFRSL